jgi:hypothetical protein
MPALSDYFVERLALRRHAAELSGITVLFHLVSGYSRQNASC